MRRPKASVKLFNGLSLDSKPLFHMRFDPVVEEVNRNTSPEEFRHVWKEELSNHMPVEY
jgi:hypothetical protein